MRHGAYLSFLVLCLAGNARCEEKAADSTSANMFFSGLVGGSYAADAVADFIEDTPLLQAIPLEIFDLEEEVVSLIQKESTRFASHFVRNQVHSWGLRGPLSLTSYSPSNKDDAARIRRAARRTRLRARISSRRVGLTFLLRF